MITNNLLEFEDKINTYKDNYKRVLRDSLNANLLPYLQKVEQQFSERLKESMINKSIMQKNSKEVKIIFDCSHIAHHRNIYFSYQDDYLVGIIAVDNVIEDYLYKKTIFSSKKQIQCTYTNYRSLVKESENIDPFLLEDTDILDQVFAESPSLIEEVRKYYENNGFTVEISTVNNRVFTLTW